MAKEFFTENKVEYTDYNVAEDAEKRQEMVDATSQMGVPVILIMDDEKPDEAPEIIIGFNEDKLRAVLGL